MLLIKLKKALPFIVAFGFILGTAATLDYARSKRVKPPESFLAKVQLAESESRKIESDNFITSDTLYKDKSRFGFPIVCSRGSYQT